ncbi:hypothetical protein Gasu2_27270 [Galdieria sulphuraria]|uniref:Mitochondrial protein translocase, MPT family n=1 Tax=Galdieria sulphuraria TaxID=130081 RepID=M2XJG3_GALSU|nr:uncharacterized protein Gasu_24090 [Galdieria sulphuraria]EME30257.1 hypothetical protein Gasu_24090 [Galdieria sulphuraria]GJD08423.1 hypothetical protein Gasu2_27270 [Galdieria sulphuraria]|eukprot:XP_005706777.1 hypothetical protein Gasu_24090 [Galdieria sulphuraria]
MKFSWNILQSRKLFVKESSNIRKYIKHFSSLYRFQPCYVVGLCSQSGPKYRTLATSNEEALKVTENRASTTEILSSARRSLTSALKKALEKDDLEQAIRLVCSVPGKATFQPYELDLIPYERLSQTQLQQLATVYDYVFQRETSEDASIERALNIYLLVKDPQKAIRILHIAGSSATPEMGLKVLQVCAAADSVSSLFECLEKLVNCGVIPEAEHIKLVLSVLEKKRREPHIKNLLDMADRSGVSMDTSLYNAFMFSSFQARRYRDVMEFLRKMNRFQLTPNEYSYSLYLAALIFRDKFRQGFEQLGKWESRGVFTLCPTLFLVMGELAVAPFRMERIVTFHGDVVKSGRKLDLESSNCLATFASFHGHVYQSFRTWRHRREKSLDFDTNSLNAILLGCVKTRRFDLAQIAWDSFSHYEIERDSHSFSLFIATMFSSLCSDKFVFSFSKDAAADFLSDIKKVEEFLRRCNNSQVTLEENEAKALLIASFLNNKDNPERLLPSLIENTSLNANILEDFSKKLREVGDVDSNTSKDILANTFTKTFPYFSQCFHDAQSLVHMFVS